MRLLLAATLLLGGCQLLSDSVGVAAGAGAAAASGNPAIGYAVGIGVRAGVDELRKYVVRVRQRGEQDAIADAAGTVPPNETRPWEIRHTIPIGNLRGTVAVADQFTTPLTTCRHVVFAVEEGGLFTTQVCQQGDHWRWAGAEPAVDRWGSLQ